MSRDTNYIATIVKILEAPKQTIGNNNLVVTECRAQFPQARKTQIVNLVFWDKLARKVTNSYQRNDYLLVEGYVSVFGVQTLKTKNVKISVLRAYPFLLGEDRSTTFVEDRTT